MIVRITSKTEKGVNALRKESKDNIVNRALDRSMGIVKKFKETGVNVILEIVMGRISSKHAEHMKPTYESFVSEELSKYGVKLDKDYIVEVE